MRALFTPCESMLLRASFRTNSKFTRLYSRKVTSSEKSQRLPTRNSIPPPKVHRVTYEYPPPPKPESQPPIESSAWKRHIPFIIGVGSLLWAGYAAYYFFGDSSAKEQGLLTPDKFSTFKITYKKQIADDLQLIEIAPKYAASSALLKSGATIWNGKKLWSIQVKHPMIQIARNYTPLPLYFLQSDRTTEPLMRIMGNSSDEGRMCLLVKRYADGEMSRYLHSLPVGSDIEIRGPFIDCKLPYEAADSQKLRQPMLDLPTRMAPEPQLDPNSGLTKASNLAIFTAGTGFTVAMQTLLSPNNPPRGFTHVFHSARTRSEVPFDRFMLFLESAGRAKFHIYIDDEQKFLKLDDIPPPAETTDAAPVSTEAAEPVSKPAAEPVAEKKYASVVQQFADKSNSGAYLPGVSRAVVCGPGGYMAYVTGDPGIDGINPIAGLLGQKGWTQKNVDRLLDL